MDFQYFILVYNDDDFIMVPSSSVLLLEACCCCCCMSPINAHYMPGGHLRSFTILWWYSAVWNMTAREPFMSYYLAVCWKT